MKRVIFALAAAFVAVASLSACGESDAQKDAIKFRELCSKNPQLEECKNSQSPGG